MTVTVEALKSQLNLSDDDDNSFLAGKIAAAVAWIEGYIGEAIPSEATPAALDEATLQLASHFYECRGDGEDEGVPVTVKCLVMPFRSWVF